MRSAWKHWLGLLDRKERGEALALFRIAVGGVVAWTLFSIWFQGHAELIWVDLAHGGYRQLGPGMPLIKLLGGPKPAVITTLCLTGAASALLLCLGVFHRLFALVTLQIWLSLSQQNVHAGGSYDELIANALWLLVLANASATLSLPLKLRSGSWHSDRLVSAWPRYLIIGQLVVVYGSTGLHKLSAHWVPGGELSALYYILQQPSWQRVDMSWLAPLFPLTQLATLSVWLWEVGAPLLLLVLWYRHTASRPGRLRSLCNRFDLRTAYAAFGIVMHLAIFAATEVGPFSWITLSFYLCLWNPDEWRRLLGTKRLQWGAS